MTYKEFVSWCNERACDGRWSAGTAMYCIDTIYKIDALPFWKRKKEWLKVKDKIEIDVVSVVNQKIKEAKDAELNRENSTDNGAVYEAGSNTIEERED